MNVCDAWFLNFNWTMRQTSLRTKNCNGILQSTIQGYYKWMSFLLPNWPWWNCNWHQFQHFFFYFISLLICFLNMLWWFDFFDARTRWEDGEVNLRKRRGKVVSTYQYYKTKQRSSFWLGKANGISSSSTTTTGSCREHRVTPLIVYLFIYWFIIFYESIP